MLVVGVVGAVRVGVVGVVGVGVVVVVVVGGGGGGDVNIHMTCFKTLSEILDAYYNHKRLK